MLPIFGASHLSPSQPFNIQSTTHIRDIMSETAITEDSLKGLMIERLKAVHVEVTDISGTSVFSCELFSMFRLRHL